MKITAEPDEIDSDMIKLYTHYQGSRYLMCAVHVDNFEGDICFLLRSGKSLTLKLEIDES